MSTTFEAATAVFGLTKEAVLREIDTHEPNEVIVEVYPTEETVAAVVRAAAKWSAKADMLDFVWPHRVALPDPLPTREEQAENVMMAARFLLFAHQDLLVCSSKNEYERAKLAGLVLPAAIREAFTHHRYPVVFLTVVIPDALFTGRPVLSSPPDEDVMPSSDFATREFSNSRDLWLRSRRSGGGGEKKNDNRDEEFIEVAYDAALDAARTDDDRIRLCALYNAVGQARTKLEIARSINSPFVNHYERVYRGSRASALEVFAVAAKTRPATCVPEACVKFGDQSYPLVAHSYAEISHDEATPSDDFMATAIAASVHTAAAEEEKRRTAPAAAAAAAVAPPPPSSSSSDDRTCSICLDRPWTCAIVECGHATFCVQCIELLTKRECPTCRLPFSQTIKIFQ
jgi:hypothetical protein